MNTLQNSAKLEEAEVAIEVEAEVEVEEVQYYAIGVETKNKVIKFNVPIRNKPKIKNQLSSRGGEYVMI